MPTTLSVNALSAAAALGWTLAVVLFIHLVVAARTLRAARFHVERLMRKHEPDAFARYTAALARSGDKPLVTQSNKES